MPSLKYRSKISLQWRFKWLSFDSLLYFLVRGRHPKLYFQSYFQSCDWRMQCWRTALWPLASYWSRLASPGPRSSLWPRHGLCLTPRSRGRRQSGGEMRLGCPLASVPGLAPTLDTLHSTECCQQTCKTMDGKYYMGRISTQVTKYVNDDILRHMWTDRI